MKPTDFRPQESDADELAALLDQLMESGTQHIRLTAGDRTVIRTVSSTDCSGVTGPCSVPNLGEDPADEPLEPDDEKEDFHGIEAAD